MRSVKEWLEDVLRVASGVRTALWVAPGAIPLVSFSEATTSSVWNLLLGFFSVLAIVAGLVISLRRNGQVLKAVRRELSTNRRISLEQLETVASEACALSRMTGLFTLGVLALSAHATTKSFGSGTSWLAFTGAGLSVAALFVAWSLSAWIKRVLLELCYGKDFGGAHPE
jgi:heme exporter protein D